MNQAPPHSIILVDDEKSYTDLMTQLLAEYFACPVHGFTNPREALTALTALSPGVIVTDYNMPQMDGLEFVREATPRLPGTAFVLISGQNLTAKEAQIAKLTVIRSVVAKPVGWKKLSEEILRVWPAGSPAPGLRADSSSI